MVRKSGWDSYTPEQRAARLDRLRQSTKERWTSQTPEERKQQLARLGEGRYSMTSDVAWKIGASVRANWESKTADERKGQLDHLASVRPGVHSRLEDKVANTLRAAGVSLIQHYQIVWYEGDIYVPSIRLVIEVDGCYWHGCLQCGYTPLPNVARNDAAKDSYLRNREYVVLRLPEHLAVQSKALGEIGRFIATLESLGD